MFIYPLFLTCLVSIVTFYQHLYHKVRNCLIHNLKQCLQFKISDFVGKEHFCRKGILEFYILEIFY